MDLNCKKCGTKNQKIVLENIDIDLIYTGNNINVIDLKIYCNNPDCVELLAVGYIREYDIIQI